MSCLRVPVAGQSGSESRLTRLAIDHRDDQLGLQCCVQVGPVLSATLIVGHMYRDWHFPSVRLVRANLEFATHLYTSPDSVSILRRCKLSRAVTFCLRIIKCASLNENGKQYMPRRDSILQGRHTLLRLATPAAEGSKASLRRLMLEL